MTTTATATGDAKCTSTIRRHEGVECDGEQLERAEKGNCLAARPATERFSGGVDNAQRRRPEQFGLPAQLADQQIQRSGGEGVHIGEPL